MADKKISQLTAITAPIASTDVLPIVQSATTKKITVAQLVPGLGSFTTPSGNVKGLVWYDGTTLGNDATVTDVGYDTVTNTVKAKNLDVSGTATLTTGNLVIGTSGKGIDFSVTSQPGGMTSELLNDYEEGTWTPVLLGGVSNPTVTYNAQVAQYTKIGRAVFYNLYVAINTVSGGSGNVRVTLPFTVPDVGSSLNYSPQNAYIAGINPGSATIQNAAQVDISKAVNTLANGNEIRVTGFYFI